MDSSATGEVGISIAGRQHVLRYDWAALSRLRTEFGKDYDKIISQAMDEVDTATLAKALACGLSPALRPEEIEKASPPIVSVNQAINKALIYAHFGKEDPGFLAKQDPTERPKARHWMSLKRAIGSLFGRA